MLNSQLITNSSAVAHWRFDASRGDIIADSQGNKDGRKTGFPSAVPGAVDNGLNFDGVSSSVRVADDPNLNFGVGDFAIALSIQTTESTGIDVILDKRIDRANFLTGYSLFLSDGKLGLQLADETGFTNYISNINIADGQWHNISVSVDRDNVLGGKWFVDGQFRGYFNPTDRQGSLSNSSDLVLGARSDNASSPGYLNASLDEVMLFNGTISNAQAAAIAESVQNPLSSTPTATPQPIASWGFNDNLGQIAADTAGNNNGTIMGLSRLKPGVFGDSLVLSGTNSQMRVAEDPVLNVGVGDFSIAASIKTSDSSGVDKILDKRVVSGSYVAGYALFLVDGKLSFQLADGVGFTNYFSNIKVANGQWHNISVSVDRDNVSGGKFYLNGQLAETFDPTDRQGSLDNLSDLVLGTFSDNIPGGYFNGNLDEVKLFNQAISAIDAASLNEELNTAHNRVSQIQDLATGHWRFDSSFGDIAADSQGNKDGIKIGGLNSVAGAIDNGLSFDGVSGSVRISDDPNLNFGTGDFSISTSIKSTDAFGLDVILDKRIDLEYQVTGYSLYVQDGFLGLQIADPTGWSNYLSSINVATGQWQQITVSVDRDNQLGGKFYVNGQLGDVFDPSNRQGSITNTSDLVLGSRSDNAVFPGYLNASLDEVMLFDKALSTVEVNSLQRATSFA